MSGYVVEPRFQSDKDTQAGATTLGSYHAAHMPQLSPVADTTIPITQHPGPHAHP